tara:strand:+ start:256 stop:1404 length:1149 start_codon:yes stop_codon:yes gene_type:complete
MPIVDIKGVGKAQFPDGMSADDIRAFLRSKYSQQAMSGQSDILSPQPGTASPYNPSLVDKIGGGIADTLTKSGLISDNYRAQQIGKNLSSIGEFLPGIGDATAGDEFGRAAAKGDGFGMAMAGLGIIPVAGDLAKKAIKSLPMNEIKKVTSYNDMFDFTPEQMAQQLRSSKPANVINGVYIEQTKFGEKRFNPDGSVEIVKGGEVLRRIEPQDADMAYKNKIMKNEGEKPEVKAAQEKRRAEFDTERIKQQAQEAESYKMQHTAPTREDNPSGDDLTDTFGSDIYTGNALQYFGTGSSYDNKAIRIIQEMKGKPEKAVTIYRAVPKSVKSINSSDWVTTTKEYAQDHMEGEEGWHILSKKVKAKDIATDGNSIHEFGYDPAQ